MKLSLLSFIGALLFAGTASAADITVYYSPSCPHCHHALNFIGEQLVYEYKTINVDAVNVANKQNLPAFKNALNKCEYERGGVPVITVGDKCFQGYAASMNQELRDAVEVDLSKQDKENAKANIKALTQNSERFKAENSDRTNVIKEINNAAPEKKTDEKSVIYFYILLVALVAGLGFILTKKERKK